MYCLALKNDKFWVFSLVNNGTDVVKTRMLVDTGSGSTVLRPSSLRGLKLSVTGKERVFETLDHGELIAKQVIAQQFTIGNLDLRETKFWLYEGITTNVLGMDLLKDISFNYEPVTKQLTIDIGDSRGSGVLLTQLCAEYDLDVSFVKQLLPGHWQEMSEYELRDCLTFIKRGF